MRRYGVGLAVAMAGFVEIALAATPTVLVTTIPVKSGAIPRSIDAYGTVGPGPGASETMTIGFAGVVGALDVMPGQAVRRGQVLAMIEATPGARAAYAQAEAAERAAASSLAHTRTLLAGHLATTIQLAQAEQAMQVAKAALEALRREGADQARTKIIAPYDGVIAGVAATPGAVLAPGGALFTLVRSTALIATIGLDPQEAGETKPGDPVALMASGHAARAVHGTVASVGAMVNPSSGLLDVSVAMPGAGFLVGQSVRAEIDIGTARGVIVPRDAALPEGKRFRIWQVKAGHARPVDVKVVARTSSSAVVRGAIDPALPIVASGNYQLKPGIAVRVTH